MTALVLEQHIVATPSIRSGKPRLEGTRITVADVVIWHFHMGYSPDEIAVKWDLSLSAIYAALSYYYDHQNEIDEQIQAADEYHARMKAVTPSRLQEKIKSLRSE
jgi:uncharacterized protein (DUF433 family)